MSELDKNVPSVYRISSKKQQAVRKLGLTLIFSLLLAGWACDPVNITFEPLVNNSAVQIRGFIPSTAVVGEEITLTVEAWDYSERLACNYHGEVSFSCVTDPSADLPDKYSFKPSGISQGVIEANRIPWGDQGYKKFKVCFNQPGFHYINITDGQHTALSNPIRVYENEPPMRLYWGDIHWHSSFCDGSGYLTQLYKTAKNIACLDFAAVTTHDHFIHGTSPLGLYPALWKTQKEITNSWNRPENGFVTMLSYEWRGEFVDLDGNFVGDRIVYSRGDDVPNFSGLHRDYDSEAEFNDALRAWSESHDTKVMTIPHHPPHSMWGLTTDWSTVEPDMTRLVEIYSVHGCSETLATEDNLFPIVNGLEYPEVSMQTDRGYTVRDAIQMGHRIGFMASSDGHEGHPGHTLSHTPARHLVQQPYSYSALPHQFRCHHWRPNGLIAVKSPSLTRENIWDSMYNRSVYAVKGISRPWINFTINGNAVGASNNSELTVQTATSERTISLDIAAGGGDENYITNVTIFKNNQIFSDVYFDVSQKRQFYTMVISDTEPVSGMSYASNMVERDGKYYIHDNADNPMDLDDVDTDGADVYYLRVTFSGSKYYTGQRYSDPNVTYLPRGSDQAWVGPFWVEVA